MVLMGLELECIRCKSVVELLNDDYCPKCADELIAIAENNLDAAVEELRQLKVSIGRIVV